MASEQPHARFYRGLPPVKQQRRWWLITGVAVTVLVIAALTAAVITVLHSSPDGTMRPDALPRFQALLDQYSVIWIGGAFVVGSVLGFVFARGRWSTVAVDSVGLVGLFLVAAPDSRRDLYSVGWLLFVVAVSAGAGVRRRLARAPLLSQPG